MEDLKQKGKKNFGTLFNHFGCCSRAHSKYQKKQQENSIIRNGRTFAFFSDSTIHN